MFRVPNQFRERKHPLLKSDDSAGLNGFFIIPHYRISEYEFRCMASNGMDWEHVSVSVAKKRQEASRCCTWEEMCHIKNIFWTEDVCVIEYHPSKSEYVNRHPYVLHLWRPISQIIPIPDKSMV